MRRFDFETGAFYIIVSKIIIKLKYTFQSPMHIIYQFLHIGKLINEYPKQNLLCKRYIPSR